jgi:hypothetical protein
MENENPHQKPSVHAALRQELLETEGWAQLAMAIGYDPVDVEGQGRDILKRLTAMGVRPVRQEENKNA